MSNPPHRPAPLRSAVLIAAALSLLVVPLASPALAEDPPAEPARPVYHIRPQYREGMTLNYQWRLSGGSLWSPPRDGVDWASGQTDFRFVLRAKTVRDNGACTFDLTGQSLEATGKSNKGTLGIEATPEKARLKINNDWTKWSDQTPLDPPMTVTLGPRFQATYGTGLEPIAIYFLPNVDRRFWYLLTTAPAEPVSVGQKWETEFELPLPGASPRGGPASKPLQVRALWEVEPIMTYRGQKVLPIRLRARLQFDPTPIVLPNGDKVMLRQGVYEATGRTMWHTTNGILCYAEARERLDASADGPDARQLKHDARSTLELTAAR